MAVQTIAIHVVPNARVTCVAGHHGGAIKIKLHAPAIEGRANDELIRFVAESLGVPRASVRLVRGAKSREKIVAVEDFAGDASGSLAGAL
ncbi:hypothetical protein AYO41_01080 [Verrucomicrobia bacterium SCGC AG-212-E04]|nr:hypothetical protein AYO41_01080 [Verrucomicrobia bacterium SCGC AG-212-E04]